MQACKDQSLSDLNDWRSWAYVNNKKSIISLEY